MKRNFDAYVLWPSDNKVQNWIIDQSTTCNFTVNAKTYQIVNSIFDHCTKLLYYFILNTQPEIHIMKVLYIYLLPLLKGALLLSVTKWVARYRVTSFDTRYDDTISDLISRFIMTLYDRRPDQTVFFYYGTKNPIVNNNIIQEAWRISSYKGQFLLWFWNVLVLVLVLTFASIFID